MTKHMSSGIISCALSALMLTLVAPKENVLARAHEVLAAAEAASACTGYCVACLYDPGHAAEIAPPACDPEICQNKDAVEGGGWHTNCLGANNCSNHECQESFASASAEERALSAPDLFRQVTDAVLREDGSALRSLVQQNPERARYVASRGAVQITACDGDVIAHYPIPNRVSEVLEH